MKDALFVFCAYVNRELLHHINRLHDALTMLVVHSAHAFFQLIDKDRMNHVRQSVEQRDAMSEMKVFALIKEVADDAICRGEWDEDHETKLNFFGNILYTEHDWAVEEVHRYLTDVIDRATDSMPTD